MLRLASDLDWDLSPPGISPRIATKTVNIQLKFRRRGAPRGNRSRGRGGRGGSRRTPKNADQLDAEMDTYMKDEV